MAGRRDLIHTADGLRDLAANLDRQSDEQKIQATMAEEQAIATHRVAEAIEELTEAIREMD